MAIAAKGGRGHLPWGFCAPLLITLVAPGVAHAEPSADDIEILRARPTGMDEVAWRAKRREIATELGSRRDKEAVDALIEIVETERYDSVLSIAIEALGKQGDARAIEPLQRVYADRSLDTFVRRDAAAAITALGGTPRDDARLVGGDASPRSDEGLLGGRQLGTMGEASVASDSTDDPTRGDKRLPSDVRARDRGFSFVLGRLSLGVNTRASQQPVLADGGLGARARYIDERQRWGFSVTGSLDASVRNGDITSAAEMGSDTGNTLLVNQALAGNGEAHVYFGKTDVHAFGGLGLSQRLVRVSVKDFGGGNQSTLSDTRFGVDVIPAGGLGFGRYLDGGSDLMVDAIVNALQTENILALPLDAEARRAIRDAVFRRSNTFSAWPRAEAVIGILQARGHLARRPGPRLVHRIRSIVEDPSYIDRPRGVRVRVGFLYDAPLAQGDRVTRGDAVGAPFVQFDAGFQISLERQILADTRLWYDVIGKKGFTTDTGVTYTRYLHTKFHDYAGQWSAGVRGGASGREIEGLPDGVDPRIGYRAVGQAGYTYGFRRGSRAGLVGEVGVDSGAFVVGVGLGLEIGVGRGSVWNPGKSEAVPPARRAPKGRAP